jgi:hypothetical protein
MTIAALAVLIAGSVAAQEPGWNFRGSLYGWVPSLSATMGTRFGDLETEANGSNALSALDVAFMGTIEARKGQWGFIGDLLYVDLSSDTDAPFGLRFDGSTLETKTSAFSGYAVYRAYESDRAIIDAGVGLRAFSLDVDLGLKSADARPDYDANESETWAVPVIATRFIFPFNESWFATAFFDGGMTSSDTSTWQAFGSVGYRFNDRWSTQVGWRYMDVQKDVGDLDVSLDLSGPLIGVSASF